MKKSLILLQRDSGELVRCVSSLCVGEGEKVIMGDGGIVIDVPVELFVTEDVVPLLTI